MGGGGALSVLSFILPSIRQNTCSQVHGYSSCLGYYSRVLINTEVNCLFRSAIAVMSDYLYSLTETVFFSACCVLTPSVVCTVCIVVGNRRKCVLSVFSVSVRERGGRERKGERQRERERERELVVYRKV